MEKQIQPLDNVETESDMTLRNALSSAVERCWGSVDDFEERGGVILRNSKSDTYLFVFLRNANTGTDIAPVLFTADRDEYAELIIPLLRNGYQHYASFHTHPKFQPWPSMIDLNELFPGFPINYIYSGLTERLFKYVWIDPHNTNCGVIPEEVEI